MDLEGKTYSATLVAAVQELLRKEGIALAEVGCIVVVTGPGSFTGVRVGLSAVKGFALGAGIPVIAVSRLEVLAHKSGCASAALDAHRNEVYLRVVQPGSGAMELLAGRTQLDQFARLSTPECIAVCDESAATLLALVWRQARFLAVTAPTAADAIGLATLRIRAARIR